VSSVSESIRCDLIQMIEDDPTPFQYGGTEYIGASSGINSRRPIEIGGFEDMPELTIAINLKNLDGSELFGPDRPGVNDQITVAGVVYRIERTEIDSSQECLQMDLRSNHA